MTLAQQAQALTELAKLRAPKDRERLLASLCTLMDDLAHTPDVKGSSVCALLDDILMPLVTEADTAIRARLSEQLASKAWVPLALVSRLSQDDFEIAQPVIAASPVLGEPEFLHLLDCASVDHQIEVARRAGLSATVIDEILTQAAPAVLTALAANHAAALTKPDLQRLVDASRRIASLRAPLARHPGLTAPMAKAMMNWVGASLKAGLLQRFALAPAPVEPLGKDSGPLDIPPDRQDMDRRLVEKVMASGHLQPGYLMRALREGQLSLFMAGLARLCDLDLPSVVRMIDSPTPDLLALACWSVGMDRSAFAPLLVQVRRLSGGLPGGDGRHAANRAFGALTANGAQAALKWALDEARV